MYLPSNQAPERQGTRMRVVVPGGSHRFKNVEESNAFVQRFSKALVDAFVRGDGSIAVWMDGRVVVHDGR